MGLTLTNPWALLLLLALPPVVWIALRGRRGGSLARRRLAAGARLLGLLLATGALAGLQIVRPSEQLSVAYLVDVSDSGGPLARAAARDWLRQSLAAMPEGDTAGIVVFGQTAMVERVPSAARGLDDLQARPATNGTDIGAAIRLGLALLPADRQRRLVILSDGRDTEGQVERAARMATASGVPVSVVTLPTSVGDEVAISQVTAPGQVRQGEQFTVEARVISNSATTATLRLYADTTLLVEQAIDLRPGENVYRLAVTATSPGFRAFRAEIEPAVDTQRANNSLATYTTIKGAPRVLIVEGAPDAGSDLADALTAAGLSVERRDPAATPASLPSYAGYDAVVLVDVPAAALGPRQELLRQYVRDLGKGLVVIGGEESYGLGGYGGTPLEAALPVTMQLRNAQQQPQVALGLTLDKSGSMGRCHGQPGQATGVGMQPAGAAKIDIAKEASLQSIRLLSPTDEVGIVAFDSQARWVAQRRPLGEQADLIDQLGTLHAEGGTNIYAGLNEAVQSMLTSSARVKHIILITDGWSRTGNFDALLDQLNQGGITLSVIGAGGGASDFLRGLAERGGGRYYDATNMDEVPRIFLKETKLALRSYIQEGRFAPRLASPSPILDGFDSLPPLSGYVGTSARPAARTVLVSDQQDPLLAHWQYGLGRAVAWTSDARGRWAADWLAWPGFSRFWGQAVKWTVAPTEGDLAVQATVSGDRASLTVESVAPGGQPRDGLATTATLLAPDGARREVPLRQIAPGRYSAEVVGLTEGAHLVAVTQRRDGAVVAATTGGLVVGYSAEYAPPDRRPNPLLAAGGRTISEPAQAFDHAGLAPAQTVADLWPLLLLLALLLLPVDIAIRRLTFGREDLALLVASLRRRPTAALAPAPAATPLLTRLSVGKARARSGLSPTPSPARPATAPDPSPNSPPPPTPAAPPAPPPVGPADTLARLREARRRARRDDR